MRLLKSLEELLFELASWLVFYPITMWRAATRPLDMMRYADIELADAPEDQYADTLSPPLFLLITLLIAQGVSSAIPSAFDPALTPKALASTSNLLISRGVIFSVFPLVMAVTLLRRKSVRLTRNTLRPPFFSQCFVVAPFVFVASLGVDFLLMPHSAGVAAGLVMMALAIGWYGRAQIRWFERDLGVGPWLAAALFARGLVLAAVTTLVLALVIGLTLQSWTA